MICKRPVIEVTSKESVVGIARRSGTVGLNVRGVVELPVAVRETGKAPSRKREWLGAWVLHIACQTQSEAFSISVSMDSHILQTSSSASPSGTGAALSTVSYGFTEELRSWESRS